jgi:hypothetical protein
MSLQHNDDPERPEERRRGIVALICIHFVVVSWTFILSWET